MRAGEGGEEVVEATLLVRLTMVTEAERVRLSAVLRAQQVVFAEGEIEEAARCDARRSWSSFSGVGTGSFEQGRG